MQYLLDNAEMAAIRADREKLRALPGGADHLEALKNVCQFVATHMSETAEVRHGCIHVEDPHGPSYQCRYCDGRRVRAICPQPQEWSK